jgi:hypothetical protein
MDINVTLGERSGIANRVFMARPVIARTRITPDLQVMRLPSRRHIGVELQSMTPQLAEYFGLSNRNGALVIFVFADSPAAKAGLKAGDVILSAGTETVERPTDLRRVLTGKSEGTIELKILRDKREQTLTVKLEKGASSWLLEPDSHTDLAFLDGFEPLTVQIPSLSISPLAVQLPKIAISPMAVRMRPMTISPLKVQVPKIDITPMAIPQVALAPMKMDVKPMAIPQVTLAPMKIDVKPMAIPQVTLAPMKVEIPKIQIKPMKILVAPRRIVL